MIISINKMQPAHWANVAKIYGEGIETDHATFQKDVPTWASWNTAHLPFGRLIAQNTEGVVLGWAALSAVSGRCVYAGVAELSVYVATSARGQGIGKLLMDNLIQESENNGIWTLQAGIFPENLGSVQLHLKSGFRQIGFREKWVKWMVFGAIRCYLSAEVALWAFDICGKHPSVFNHFNSLNLPFNST